MRLLSALAVAAFVVVALALATRHDRLLARLRAMRIIRGSRAAYAACATYEDDGRLETTFRGEAAHIQVTKFRTTFAGPGRLRFAYLDLATEYFPPRLTQLIADETGVRSATSWLGEVSREQEGSISAAAAAFGGVSQGLTGAILPMLRTGIDGLGDSLDMTDAVRVPNEDVEGESCDVVEGVRGTTRVRIWIASRDSFIRRITEDTTLSEDELRATGASLPERLHNPARSDCDAAVGAPNATADGLSFFVDTIFHPRCGGAVDPRALQESDSL
jgi:hypothetical protein